MSSRATVAPQEQVRRWVKAAVVDLNLCPFARAELRAGRVRIEVAPAGDLEAALECFADAAIALVQGEQRATTLLVLPHGFEDFDDYLDLLELCERLLEECGWDAALQLASFHPQYCFDGEPEDDPANYTNRAPLPVVHLLRRDDLAAAIANYPDVDSIPLHNQALARARGAAFFEALLTRCRTDAN